MIWKNQGVGVSVGVEVGVIVGVFVGVSVGVLVAVTVGVSVGVLVAVEVGVMVGVSVEVGVGVLVGGIPNGHDKLLFLSSVLASASIVLRLLLANAALTSAMTSEGVRG